MSADLGIAARPLLAPRALKAGLWLVALLGLASLGAGLALGRPAWTVAAALSATLIALGVSQAGVVWAAIFEITGSRWGRSFKRLAELCLAGAPLALLVLLALLCTAGRWAPFAHEPLVGGKAVWLDLPFWAVRTFLAVLGLFALSAWYVYHSLRPDVGLVCERDKTFPHRLGGLLIRGWRGAAAEIARSRARRATLAPILCLGYAIVHSLIGFDLVMALDPEWSSTLFGAYHFIGSAYLGLAVIILLGAATGRRGEARALFSGKHFGLAGSLLFAFCMVMGDFFWSQFLTIWYGNLPEETPYLLLRTLDPELPWRVLAWAVLGGFFALPFLALLFRAVKWRPGRLSLVAGVVILSLVGERFLCAAPPLLKLLPGADPLALWIPFGLALGATLGLLALSGLLFCALARQVPRLPVSDPLLAESLKDSEERP